MQENNNPQNYGNGGNQGQTPSQGQHQQQSPYNQPQQYNHPVQQQKSKKPRILTIAIVVIIIIAAIAAYFLFFSNQGLEGEWRTSETIEEGGVTGYFNMTIGFNNDGTGTMDIETYAPDFGSQEETENFEWETVGDNELEITVDGDNETVEYEIRDRGNTLVLFIDEFEEFLGTNELEFERI